SVEFGIGYEGVFSNYRVYESYAQMHYVQGLLHDDNGHAFHAVIPNYYDPTEFPFREQKDDFFLFIGRMTLRKGPSVAAEVTRRLGAKLVMAGQGVERIEGNKIIAKELSIEGEHILHMGRSAGLKDRGELMSRAK